MQQKGNKHYIFMKSKIIVLGVIFVSLTMYKSCARSCSNSLSFLTERGFFIPRESSIFCFEVTEWNAGSGEWWLYGEDDKYYYGLSSYNDCDSILKIYNFYTDFDCYFKLKKGDEPENFDKFNKDTWGEKIEYDFRERIKEKLGLDDYWHYAEDDNYYYGSLYYRDCYSILKEHNIEPYACSDFYFKLQKGNEPENFDKLDYHTWGGKIEYNLKK